MIQKCVAANNYRHSMLLWAMHWSGMSMLKWYRVQRFSGHAPEGAD